LKKTKIREALVGFMAYCLETNKSGILESLLIRPVVYPAGKLMTPHLPAGAGSYDLRCQGFGVDYYSLTLDVLDLQHPRLLQH
jgi:hypothetical protein